MAELTHQAIEQPVEILPEAQGGEGQRHSSAAEKEIRAKAPLPDQIRKIG
jgi:hypothetical protein